MSARPLDVAQHEAAHVVVGVALGLRLHSASALPSPKEDLLGHAWFPYGSRIALSIMYSAGVAWDRLTGAGLSEGDVVLVREIERSAAGVRASVRAARALITELRGVHAQVTRALLKQDLRHQHIAALARGERLVDE